MGTRIKDAARSSSLTEGLIALAVGFAGVALAWRMLGLGFSRLTEPWAGGDALGLYAATKAMQQHGWYSPNPSLGFPFGQDLAVFPNLDLVHIALLKALSTATSNPYLPVNAFNLLVFFVIGTAGYLLMRYAGASRLVSAPLAVSVSLAPWHFERLAGHYFLADYSPLIVGLFMAVFTIRRVREAAAPSSSRWGLLATLGVILASGFYVAGGGLYWAYASVLVITVMALPTLYAYRSRRGAIIAALALATIPVFALAWLEIQKLMSNVPDGARAFQRKYIESEMYGGSLMSAILGSPLSGIGHVAETRLEWQAVTSIGSGIESWPWNSVIGIVAIIWSLLLVGLSVSSIRGVDGVGARPRARSLTAFSTRLNADSWPVALLLFIAMYAMTGLGSVTMFWFFTDVRAWGRFFVGLMLVATVIFALSLSQLSRRYGSFVALAIAAALCLTIYADQVRGAYRLENTAPAESARDAAHLVAEIERRSPRGCGVLTLPVLPYPESWPINRMLDYDPLWLYVGSSDLGFTYGIPKNLPQAGWQDQYADPTSMASIDALRSRGVCGVAIDAFGYASQPPPLVTQLSRLTGNAALVSPSGRWFYIPLEKPN